MQNIFLKTKKQSLRALLPSYINGTVTEHVCICFSTQLLFSVCAARILYLTGICAPETDKLFKMTWGCSNEKNCPSHILKPKLLLSTIQILLMFPFFSMKKTSVSTTGYFPSRKRMGGTFSVKEVNGRYLGYQLQNTVCANAVIRLVA